MSTKTHVTKGWKAPKNPKVRLRIKEYTPHTGYCVDTYEVELALSGDPRYYRQAIFNACRDTYGPKCVGTTEYGWQFSQTRGGTATLTWVNIDDCSWLMLAPKQTFRMFVGDIDNP